MLRPARAGVRLVTEHVVEIILGTRINARANRRVQQLFQPRSVMGAQRFHKWLRKGALDGGFVGGGGPSAGRQKKQ